MINEPMGVREKVAAVLKPATTSIPPGPSGPGGTWLSNAKSIASMLPVIAFKIWYSDGTSFTGRTGDEWAFAHSYDVQQVAYFHEGGLRTISNGCDEYCFPARKETKLGKLITDIEADLIRCLALADKWRP